MLTYKQYVITPAQFNLTCSQVCLVHRDRPWTTVHSGVVKYEPSLVPMCSGNEMHSFLQVQNRGLHDGYTPVSIAIYTGP